MRLPTPSVLLAFDFDGTLILPGGNPPFHPQLLPYLQAIRARGGAWILNTGRTLGQAVNGLAEAGIFMLPDYIIANEHDLYMPVGPTQWDPIGNWNKNIEKETKGFQRRHRKLYAELKGWVNSETKADAIDGKDGALGVVAPDHAEMERVCTYIARFQAQHPEIGYQRNGNYLRMCHADFHKGSSLAELSRILGVEPLSVFAAGDNYNDLKMFDSRISGMHACPSNAIDEVKLAVSSGGGFVATAPASQGMIQALEHMFGEPWGITPA